MKEGKKIVRDRESSRKKQWRQLVWCSRVEQAVAGSSGMQQQAVISDNVSVLKQWMLEYSGNYNGKYDIKKFGNGQYQI